MFHEQTSASSCNISQLQNKSSTHKLARESGKDIKHNLLYVYQLCLITKGDNWNPLTQESQKQRKEKLSKLYATKQIENISKVSSVFEFQFILLPDDKNNSIPICMFSQKPELEMDKGKSTKVVEWKTVLSILFR